MKIRPSIKEEIKYLEEAKARYKKNGQRFPAFMAKRLAELTKKIY